ncbi:MAG: hypothetical protein ABSD98_10040 [Candidatus Korobacteraceae bacterium]|jgi:hypothetical protein
MRKARDQHAAGLKAWRTRRTVSAFAKARAAEAASKEALRFYCEEHGWKLAVFESAKGNPRTGIIDAVALRLDRKNPDLLDVRLIQLKGGKAGITAAEINRLKKAVSVAKIDWLLAAFDGSALHLVPDDPHKQKVSL